jgi:hypothetical protein
MAVGVRELHVMGESEQRLHGIAQRGHRRRSESWHTELVRVIASASASASSSATVDTTGLSFDSDDCAVYFGASKEFRIRFEPTGIARLAFEYYDSLTDSYVTGASFLK